MYLAATKLVLRKINFGVWFIQTFLQKMLYMPNFPYTSSTVNMQIMNQFHTHSQKKQNPAKKFIKSGQIEITQRRRRWDCAVKARSVRSSYERRDWCHRPTSSAIDDRDRRTARSTSMIDEQCNRRRSLFFLSLSLSPIWALSSLSLSLSFSENDLKWKWECKIISGSKE